MSASGIPLITDSGISMLLGTSLSQGSTSGGLKGSARWMAPEILRVELRTELSADERTAPMQEVYRLQLADVWAFGMTVYVSGLLSTLFEPIQCVLLASDTILPGDPNQGIAICRSPQRCPSYLRYHPRRIAVLSSTLGAMA